MSHNSADAQREVLDLGRHWAEAELHNDVNALESMLTDDFVCVGPFGFVLNKEQYLTPKRVGDLKHESFAWQDVDVRVYDDFAITVGSQIQKSTYQDRDASGRFRETQIMVRQDGHWAIASLHLSPIAQPPGTGPVMR